MKFLPDVDLYAEWREWAKALIFELTKPEQQKILKLVPYTCSRLPNPNEDGMVVFCTDDVRGAQPVFSLGGEWLSFRDSVEVGTRVFSDDFAVEFY